jgi:hypothetical protein
MSALAIAAPVSSFSLLITCMIVPVSA